MFRYWRMQCLWIYLALLAVDVLGAERLVVDFMPSSGEQRSAWIKLLNDFKQSNPDIEVVNQELDQEAYKRRFMSRLKTSDIDIAFWFAGSRLEKVVEQDLLKPVDSLTEPEQLTLQFTPASLAATGVAGHQYGVPLSYYQWGFFYRTSLFKQLGLRAPATWSEFIKVAQALKQAGVTPTAVGAKNGWPAGAWFDYLNLRLNGLAFHRSLLHGDVPFSDLRVRKVFETWQDLLRRGYFLEAANKLDWEGVLPYLYRNKVGMVLMGGFAAAKFPEAIAHDIAFFPFPAMKLAMPSYEDAPLDILVFPTRGQNTKATRRFIRFLSETKVLNHFNESIKLISPRLDAPASADMTLAAGKKLLDRAAGISFYFDRDASPSLTEAGFAAFQYLLEPPYDAQGALSALTR